MGPKVSPHQHVFGPVSGDLFVTAKFIGPIACIWTCVVSKPPSKTQPAGLHVCPHARVTTIDRFHYKISACLCIIIIVLWWIVVHVCVCVHSVALCMHVVHAGSGELMWLGAIWSGLKQQVFCYILYTLGSGKVQYVVKLLCFHGKEMMFVGQATAFL